MTAPDDLHHRDSEVLDAALRALADAAGIKSEVTELAACAEDTSIADAIVNLNANGTTHRYFAACKRLVDRTAALALIHSQLADFPEPALLVTPYLSPQLAEHSRTIGLQFIDAAGNAHLNTDGLYVFISGRKPRDLPARAPVRGANNATALRMVFALLSEPSLLQAPYREIAQAADIALGSVGPVFQALATRGLLVESATGRRLTDPWRVLDEWTTSYPTALRPKLHARRFRSPDPDWWQHVDVATLSGCWSGEIAAARMTHYFKPATQTLYIAPSAMRDTLRQLVTAHRLQAQPDGPIELLETFWQPPAGRAAQNDLVSPILAYADLMASMSPRNIEVASLIRKEDLARVLDPL